MKEQTVTDYRKLNSFVVLMGNPDSGKWSVAVQAPTQEDAREHFLALKAEKIPTILIDTTDFVTF